MAKGSSGHFHGTKEELIFEVRSRGDKITPEKVLSIGKDKDGRIVWLEEGRLEPKPSGYVHILDEHGNEFADKGIMKEEIPRFVVSAAVKGEKVGYDGNRRVFEYTWKGKIIHIAITIGDNGYIVGANFVEKWKDKSR